MKSFNNVLVIASEPNLTRAAVESAVRVTAAPGGMVTLLVVGPRSPRSLGSSRPANRQTEPGPLDRLYDPGPRLQRMGVPVRHEFATGSPHAAVMDRIDRLGHDLVIVGDRSETRFGGRSLAARLLRNAPIPVWVQGDQVDYSAPIAVAVGPAVEEDAGDRLARELIGTASSLASAQDLPLHVVHAWRLTGETLMRSPRLSYQPTDIEQMGRFALSEAHLRIERLLAEAAEPTISTRVHVAKGHARNVIPDVVSRIVPSLLVMGTVSRSGIPGMIVGNSAERFAGQMDLPLLAVKPKGITTPSAQIDNWSALALPY